MEIKFEICGNKVSMYETVKEVDEETITKKNITLLTRDNTNLPQFDNVENIGENNNSIMIEAGVTKKLKKWTIKGLLCVSIE